MQLCINIQCCSTIRLPKDTTLNFLFLLYIKKLTIVTICRYYLQKGSPYRRISVKYWCGFAGKFSKQFLQLLPVIYRHVISATHKHIKVSVLPTQSVFNSVSSDCFQNIVPNLSSKKQNLYVCGFRKLLFRRKTS